MPSARDERRGPQPNTEPSSPSDLGSVADSVQSLRHLAENLSLPAINETEKKLKQVIEQLASMQENLSKLNEARARPPVAPPEPEPKRRVGPKSGSPNVIPFPVAHRFEERSASEDSPPVKEPTRNTVSNDADTAPQAEPYSYPSIESISDTIEDSHARLKDLPDKAERVADEALEPETHPIEPVAQNVPEEPQPRPRLDTSAPQTSAPEPESAPAVTPELIAEDEPVVRDRTASSARSAAVDNEIRALMKQYGEVDIYADRETNKQNLLKAVIAGFVLIAVLMGSYLLFS